MRALAESFSDYTQLRRVRTRRSGSRIFVDLFLEFPPEIPAGELLNRTAGIKALVERDVPDCEAWVIPVRPPPSEP
jgi:divalent metal cation (Fe/Co/Zn/Cd) transporter